MAAPSVPALIRTLNDQNTRVREMAAVALGSIGSTAESAVWTLIPMLSDESEQVRSFVADALGSIGTDEALSALSSYHR